MFNSNIDKDVWKKMKKFILDNYDYNELASKLLSYKTRTTNSIQEFMDDFLGLYISPKNRLMNSLLIGPGLPGGMMGSLMADLEKNLETINKNNIKNNI